MSFALKKFQEELAALLFTFNQHFQKLGWVPLAASAAIDFPSFIEWVWAHESRRTKLAALNAIDDEASALAAGGKVAGALALSKKYYNGLFLLFRDYDKAVEAAYRARCRRAAAPQEELAGVGA